MSSIKWIIIGVALVAIGAVTLIYLFPPTRRAKTLSGPIAIIKGDIPKHGFIGIEFDPSPDGRGLVLGEVLPGSGADASGLRKGDVLLAVDTVPLAGAEDLQRVVAEKKPGEVVRLDVERNAKALTLDVTLIGFEKIVELRDSKERMLDAP
jgi:S1-C subfamily serine protease